MPTRADFVEAARSYMGTKWRHQGRSRMGIDCVGLVLCSLADIDVIIPDKQGYRRTPDPTMFLTHIRDNSDPGVAEFGNLAIFRDGNQPCHVGIFGELYGELSIIHAYLGTGVVMEEPFIHQWPSKLIEARSIRDLEWVN